MDGEMIFLSTVLVVIRGIMFYFTSEKWLTNWSRWSWYSVLTSEKKEHLGKKWLDGHLVTEDQKEDVLYG